MKLSISAGVFFFIEFFEVKKLGCLAYRMTSILLVCISVEISVLSLPYAAC